MAFVPPTSIDPGTVTIAGVVTVSNTVAVSAVSLPLPTGAATEATLATAGDALDDVGLTAILQRERMKTE